MNKIWFMILLITLLLLSCVNKGKSDSKLNPLIFLLANGSPSSAMISCEDSSKAICLKGNAETFSCKEGYSSVLKCKDSNLMVECENGKIDSSLSGNLYYYSESSQVHSPYSIQTICENQGGDIRGIFNLKMNVYQEESGKIFAGSCTVSADVCLDYYNYDFVDKSCEIFRGKKSNINKCSTTKYKCKISTGSNSYLITHYGDGITKESAVLGCSQSGGSFTEN